ncbi:flagellar hook-associated protein FlgK [Zhenpiania hominis]|uniref:Flagellar hook-associated protein 1 n=1 Tax=Zhenpiania hominis TaxID=2763644 RepID=A0A923SPA0_9FIRM|nr:flagellar hook-associated protein FlgK [Zhenpiania hominis]MBC6678342.1 flagellar hook-associated protein FlgK [Zhenpiania hominis]
MLRSTFAGFMTAQQALTASQRSLDVTGQNISNINTTGYTRQRLDLASISTTGASYSNMANNSKVGQGVQMTGVTQIRDPFLDIQYRDHLAQVGTIDAQNTILSDIGQIFDEVDMEGFRNALNDVVTQLQNMQSQDNVNQGASDTLVRSSMEVLLTILREKSVEVDRVRSDLITKLESTDIGNINGYLQSIAELNKSIRNSQVLGSPALELMDQRNQLIDELATYLPIDVTYYDVNLGGDYKVDALKITFTDTDGNTYTLIDDDQAGEVRLNADNPSQVTFGIRDVNGKETNDLTDVLGEGVLKGALDMLNKSGDFDNPVTDVRGIGYYKQTLDNLVDVFAKKFNELNRQPKLDANGQIETDPITGEIVYQDPPTPLFETSDGSGTFTAENIRIAEGWLNGDYGIVTTVVPGPNGEYSSTANDNVLNMINAMEEDQKFAHFTGSFFEAYDNIQNTQAVDQKSSNSILSNRVAVMNQIADSKDSVAGVYLDEEVMNLMKYQQSYNAAARLMTTLDEALDTLINNTGVVGR